MDFATNSQFLSPKSFISSIKKSKDFDIKGLLEVLHINNDVNAQVKLFSTLSAYLMSNGADINVIITYTSLYDKICYILSNCPPKKTTVMFNFISALLYTVEEDTSSRTKSLNVYAKNMIRSSGCLATMCELFTSCMMHQDAWRSLCRCLAEVCRNIEANQSYCTHLVPMCVQKCSQRNLEVFLVLQSLLQNHTRNISLFIDCNGISLFQREFLQHDACLQLLSTLVQNSTQAVELINEIGVTTHLRDFLRLYGPQSQLGQWATIILYYITGTKVSSENPASVNQMIENKPIDKPINKSLAANVDLECSANTTRFFQHVMKEIVQCSPPSDLKYLQGLLPAQCSNTQRFIAYTQQDLFKNNLQRSKIGPPKQNVTRYNLCQPHNSVILNEGRRKKIINNLSLSFSFMQKQNVTNYDTADKITESLQRTVHSRLVNSRRSIDTNESIRSINFHAEDMTDFKPKYASTPKKNNKSKPSINERRKYNGTPKSIQRSIREHKIQRRVVPKKNLKPLELSKDDKEKNHRSISGWFFEAINESCTTLVKTVKNIFRPKISLEETQEKSSSKLSNKDLSSCSYSFTNYMRKRDAILKNKCYKKSNDDYVDASMELSNTCNSCNDTIVLKHKLANDEYLKQTVRKLKLGINLYGCDFKKISKQLWPQQSYMTPVVLYNLYRKLIVK